MTIFNLIIGLFIVIGIAILVFHQRLERIERMVYLIRHQMPDKLREQEEEYRKRILKADKEVEDFKKEMEQREK